MSQKDEGCQNGKLRADKWKEPFLGWRFDLQELSNSYFRLTGMDEWGRNVSRDGWDPEELLDECKKDIIEIISRK